MSAHRHLRVIDGHGQVVDEASAEVVALERELRAKRRRITELENQLAEQEGRSPEAKQVLEVLEYWRPLCMPRAKIVPKSERWRKTKDRLHDKDLTTGELAYTVLDLKAAVVGAKLSPDHVANGWLDASTIFRDSTTVDKHIARCTTFRRETGVSALEIVDELMGPGLAKLAARCACGHLRLDHERENPAEELFDPPCAVHGCVCEGFDSFDHEIELWKAQQDRKARERMGQ